jgi:hypothetical protein
MTTFRYICLHLPTGQGFPREVQYLTFTEFYHTLCRWNLQQPNTWQYAPIE